MNVIILINALSENALPDELDVLEQVEVVEKSLNELGHTHQRVFMDLNLQKTKEQLLLLKPDVVFNLFE
ncbi:MAG: hypothetical protein JXR68_05080, partial [Bacteroidales bacterium]|nr:hypothetical protein [Bacteroidales bacterium]